MPGKIKVKVLAGRNLPVMDRAGDTTDAFVEIKFGGVTHKTDVCRKSLNPHWNSTEWYRFEVDESELQDEPLQLRLMDHDTYSANDAIGKVVISLAPLLAKEANNAKGTAPHGGAVMSGWIPVFDTMHGIRGELNVIVKVELFSDFNKYKTSSVGVQFFHCPMIPPGYKATAIHGFVEELVVNDDPEYQWIDKIRTPRASNEARQVAFIKLSNQVQRLVGLKAAELGANAVVGYQQDFDLEGEAGVVARAIGTAVSITPLPTPSHPTNIPCTQQQLKKYLDILATDNNSITDLNQYYKTHQEELQRMVAILNPKTPSLLDETDNGDEDDKSFELCSQPSVNNYTGSISIYQNDYMKTKGLKHLSEDQSDLNRLLNRREEASSELISPLKKIKQIKANLFSKRLSNLRSHKTGQNKQDDQLSLRSNSSDSSRISLTDIKNEFKKLKRLKKPKLCKVITNKEDEGIGMASILARSVIHAHSSLACIAEAQDSEISPCSTLRRASESQPTMSTSDEDKPPKKKIQKIANFSQNKYRNKTLQIRFASLDNISTNDHTPLFSGKFSKSCPTFSLIARDDNLLKLPDKLLSSDSSAISGESSTEMYSSSDEDDESSDLKTDTDRSIETTSSIVQSVLSHGVNPDFITQMNRKLSILDKESTPELSENIHGKIADSQYKLVRRETDTKPDNVENNTKGSENNNKVERKDKNIIHPKDTNFFVNVKLNSNFKIQNPFTHKKASKSLSAPASPHEKKNFVYRSSSRIKHQLSKISKNNLIKSLSHYSLLPKKKRLDTKISMSQPNSSSDIPSKNHSHETVLGSPFLSYADLLSLDKDELETAKHIEKSDEVPRTKLSIYIGSEPVSRNSLSIPSSPFNEKEERLFDHKFHKKEKSSIKPTGLLHTAMETILIDKVQSLLIPTSPDHVNAKDQHFFNNVNEKLEMIEKNRNKENNQDHIKESSKTKKGKRLVRQDSVRSESSDQLRKMSKDIDPNLVISQKVIQTTPVLQHFHPILSGVPKLETIPSLSESNLGRSESLDTSETVKAHECGQECDICESNYTNKASVCDNLHAACGVDRNERDRDKNDKERGSPRHARHESYGGRDPVGSASHAQNSSLNASSTPLGMHRRSSDSDLSITPKGSSLNTSVGNTGSGGGAILRPSMNSNNLEMLEYPFLTMAEYPPGFIVHLGGTVCARSVKLVDGGGESAARAAWWAELRTELRAHSRALRCNAVIAYSETAAICEDVCVLSASGTGAVINLDCDFNAEDVQTAGGHAGGSKSTIEEVETECCGIAHVPYSPGSGPYRAELSPCGGCRRARVPAVLLATCAKPSRLISYAKAITLTAVATRIRRAQPGAEPGARDISDQLPFLEYELHKLLLAKLRMQGANALFSLKTQISIGERCVMALASGTAVRLAALPPPAPPRIKAVENDKEALEIQKALWDTFTANKAANGYDVGIPDYNTNGVLPEVEGEEPPVLDLCSDKDACVLELDEAEDVETARTLATRHTAMQVFSNALRSLPRAQPHAFVQVFRARLPLSNQGGISTVAERHVSRALESVTYKLRRLQPCALVTPRFQVELPEDEIQLVLSGAAIPLMGATRPETSAMGESQPSGSQASGTGDGDDEIFALDEEQLVKESQTEVVDEKTCVQPAAVSLSTLSLLSGTRDVRRVCALRLLFVRETTAVRELGGLSGFLHTFTCEVLAICRAYTAALGGNALTSFYITQLMLQDNAHKNQGQCLLSVGGDVVHITY